MKRYAVESLPAKTRTVFFCFCFAFILQVCTFAEGSGVCDSVIHTYRTEHFIINSDLDPACAEFVKAAAEKYYQSVITLAATRLRPKGSSNERSWRGSPVIIGASVGQASGLITPRSEVFVL